MRRAFEAVRAIRRKITSRNVIRKKLLLYFLITSILVNLICLYTYNNTRLLISQLNRIFLNDIALTSLENSVSDVESSIKSYLTTSHSEALAGYLNKSNQLRKQTARLNATLSTTQSELLLVDIKGMITTYLEYTDAAESGKRGRDIAAYSQSFNNANRVYGFITRYIDKLKIYEFQQNNANYLEIDGWLVLLQAFNIVVILLAMAVNIVLIVWFSYSMTDPILRLSKAAGEIADGNYDIPAVLVKSRDEVQSLAVAFNRMTESIRRQVVEIRQKAEIENRLQEQELQNLKMATMLSDAQLKSLQAQINPHFMFNTLNAGMQLAMFEGAERTEAFMERLSESLRYSLGTMDKPATLSQEITHIDNYVYLLKERYGDRITYTKDIEEDLPEVAMPRMILQPIVENAFLHGIAGMEAGGVITLSARLSRGCVSVEIEDNGAGMSGETAARLLAGQPAGADGKQHGGHSIGLSNVIGRLTLFYGVSDALKLIDIASEAGEGTRVTLTLPYTRTEDKPCISC